MTGEEVRKLIGECAAKGDRVVLVGAKLRDSDLVGADLRDSDLRDSDLVGANLRGADLRGSDLRGADLRGANLRGADLRGSNLRGADLRGANLRGANLSGAKLPSPTMVLLASWGSLSDATTLALMRFDASCHPSGTAAFNRWAAGGGCPYQACNVQRAADFSECRDLWTPGRTVGPYKLMAMVLDEKCPGWRDEQKG